MSIGAWTADRRSDYQAAVAPAAIEVALAVQDEIASRVEEASTLRRAQLERARYEAEPARRRHLKVDPDNRLVADALEADWNGRLRRLDALQQDHDQQQQADQGSLSEPARQRIRGSRRAYKLKSRLERFRDSRHAPATN